MPEDELPQNSVDEGRLTRREKAIKRRALEEQRQLREVLDTASGRAVLMRVLQDGRVYEQSFNPDNPHWTSFNEGCRSVGNRLLARIELAASEKLAMMREEARKALQEDDDA